jgi:hypothetical protein
MANPKSAVGWVSLGDGDWRRGPYELRKFSVLGGGACWILHFEGVPYISHGREARFDRVAAAKRFVDLLLITAKIKRSAP